MGVIALFVGKEGIVEDIGGSEGKGGVLMVPWISRIARPEGVWRRVGRGLVVLERVTGGMWSGIEGIVVVMIEVVAHRSD